MFPCKKKNTSHLNLRFRNFVNDLMTKRFFESLEQNILSIFCFRFCSTNSLHKQGRPWQVRLRWQHGAAPLSAERPPGLPEIPGERWGEHVEARQWYAHCHGRCRDKEPAAVRRVPGQKHEPGEIEAPQC